MENDYKIIEEIILPNTTENKDNIKNQQSPPEHQGGEEEKKTEEKKIKKSNGENNPLEIILKKICFSKKYDRPTKKIPIEILQNQLIKLVV